MMKYEQVSVRTDKARHSVLTLLPMYLLRAAGGNSKEYSVPCDSTPCMHSRDTGGAGSGYALPSRHCSTFWYRLSTGPDK